MGGIGKEHEVEPQESRGEAEEREQEEEAG
jgi:hypothetical protein